MFVNFSIPINTHSACFLDWIYFADHKTNLYLEKTVSWLLKVPMVYWVWVEHSWTPENITKKFKEQFKSRYTLVIQGEMSCYPTVIKAKCVKSKWFITVQKFDQQNCLVCLEIELEHLLFCIIVKCTLNMTDKEVYIANI